MRIPLGPWRPDVAATLDPSTGILAEVRNAWRTATDWRPLQAPRPAAEPSIASPVQGLFAASRLDGALELFAGADGALLRIPNRNAALPAGSGYSAAPAARWRVVQFGSDLLATNGADPIQRYDLAGGDGSFADLSSEAPRARFLAVVRDLVVAAYTWDEDGEDAYRVRWHGYVDGLPDPREWTPSLETGADFQRVADVGIIQGLTGGRFGTLVCERGIVRMTPTGGRYSFQFDVVEDQIGSRVPNSVIGYRGLTLFYAPTGWQAFDGQAVRPIGAEKIDRWFADDFDEGLAHLVWPAVDLRRGRQQVMWLYPGQGHRGRPNRLLIWHATLDEWSVADIEADALAQGTGFAADLDDDTMFPDLDAWEGDLDDPSLWQTLPQLVLVKDGRVHDFAGEPLEARFEPGDLRVGDGRRGVLTRAMALHAGGAARLSVGAKERIGGEVAWQGPWSPQSDGWLRFRVPGRAHRVRLELSGNWRRASGLELQGAMAGER